MTDFLEKQIEDIAIRLPKPPAKARKNIYDILGVQRKETANSRVLAYFLDAKEEHQFNYLFFDALKELLEEKKYQETDSDINIFNGNYKVITEDITFRADDETQKQKRIDISIEGDDWCIIIENKINHILNNPLKTYWEHAKEKFPSNIIGVILSITKIHAKSCIVNDEIRYINITHKELINRVQKNLLIGTKTNDLSLFYLKEYIKNIESHYKSLTDKPKMNEVVNAIVKQGKNIKDIIKKVEASEAFINEEIKEVFELYGFYKDKNWYRNHDMHKDLYFWVHDSKKILFENSLWFCFETRNHTNKKLDKSKLKDLYKDFKISDTRIRFGNDDNSKIRTHIAKFSSTNFLKEGENFRDEFTKVLDNFFMDTNSGIVSQTVRHIEKNKIIINNL